MGRSWPIPLLGKEMPWQLQCAFHLFAVIASTGGPADHSMPLAHGGKGFARRLLPVGCSVRVGGPRDATETSSPMFTHKTGGYLSPDEDVAGALASRISLSTGPPGAGRLPDPR
jgi:hypothetical protein